MWVLRRGMFLSLLVVNCWFPWEILRFVSDSFLFFLNPFTCCLLLSLEAVRELGKKTWVPLYSNFIFGFMNILLRGFSLASVETVAFPGQGIGVVIFCNYEFNSPLSVWLVCLAEDLLVTIRSLPRNHYF